MILWILLIILAVIAIIVFHLYEQQKIKVGDFVKTDTVGRLFKVTDLINSNYIHAVSNDGGRYLFHYNEITKVTVVGKK